MRALCLFVLLGACQRDIDVGPDFGGRCTQPEDCTRRCLPAPAFPGGFCSRDCTRDLDCPIGAACLAVTGGAACVFSCFDDRDCAFLDSELASGWGCRERVRGDAGVGLFCLGP